MPNKERLREWRDALLSGEYPQTQGTLRRTESDDYNSAGYCCLGVACDISQLGEWDGISAYASGNDETTSLASGYLSIDVMNWYGLETASVIVKQETVNTLFGLNYSIDPSLAQLNDDGVSFEDIAKIITAEFSLD